MDFNDLPIILQILFFVITSLGAALGLGIIGGIILIGPKNFFNWIFKNKV